MALESQVRGLQRLLTERSPSIAKEPRGDVGSGTYMVEIKRVRQSAGGITITFDALTPDHSTEFSLSRNHHVHAQSLPLALHRRSRSHVSAAARAARGPVAPMNLSPGRYVQHWNDQPPYASRWSMARSQRWSSGTCRSSRSGWCRTKASSGRSHGRINLQRHGPPLMPNTFDARPDADSRRLPSRYSRGHTFGMVPPTPCLTMCSARPTSFPRDASSRAGNSTRAPCANTSRPLAATS